jgi:hypothetical protein
MKRVALRYVLLLALAVVAVVPTIAAARALRRFRGRSPRS